MLELEGSKETSDRASRNKMFVINKMSKLLCRPPFSRLRIRRWLRKHQLILGNDELKNARQRNAPKNLLD